MRPRMAPTQAARRVGGVTRVPVHLVRTYPVRWTEFAVLRDFLQNFYDAATPTRFHGAVAIDHERDGVRVHMGGPGFALDAASSTSPLTGFLDPE